MNEEKDYDEASAVYLLDRLLDIIEGGAGLYVGSYGASTIITLLIDSKYRSRVMSQISDFDYMNG